MTAPIVFLHGLGQQPPSWQPVITACAQRGIGSRWFAPWVLSPKDERFDVATAVGKVAQTIELQAGGQTDVVGIGPGASVALALAADAPDLVGRVVALDPIVHLGFTERTALRLLARTMPVRNQAQRERLRRELRDLADVDLRPVLGGIAAETLILVGESDPSGRKRADALARQLPAAQVRAIAGYRGQQLLDPEGLVASLAAFLAPASDAETPAGSDQR